MSKQIATDIVDKLYRLLSPCRICPRKCGVDRLAGEIGNCRAGIDVKVSSYHQHYGEEPPLVGKHGSGTIFFAHCNLHCVYCQNWEISQLGMGKETSLDELASMMLRLQELGCHNVNFVTPTPWIPQIIKALSIAQNRGLKVPVVYNCGGYESPEVLRLLEGIIDIYMPDIKYSNNEYADKYSSATGYWEIVKAALLEMFRQVGDMKLENGIAQKGLLIRHLVLPNDIAGSKKGFEFIRQNLSERTVVNVMAQYYPIYRANQYPDIARRITTKEFRRALTELGKNGLDKGFKQTIDTLFRAVIPEWTDDLGPD
jgi:putative pyruvate formate lyase activating enzyme